MPISGARYNSRLEAVILDWAGTTVDHGSLAPVRVLQQIFAARGVSISEQAARREMGLPKRDHIQKILCQPEVAASWQARFGHLPAEPDLDHLFADFVPLQLARLREHSAVIEGVAPAIARLRARGLKIGSTTGYTRAMLDLLLPHAAAQGYQPDFAVAPEQVGGGRPHPWMIFENAIRLRVDALWAVVKIGDTPGDIEEGLNAGVWTIGVARTGNMVGMTAADFDALSPAEKGARLGKARGELQQAGAHAVVDSVAECEPALDEIESRLARGERP